MTNAEQMEVVHAAGVERHPHEWFNANRAAIAAASHCNFDYSSDDGKLLLSRVVLRVLDVVSPSTEGR